MLFRSPKTQKYAVYKNISDNQLGLFGGGINKGEDIKDGVLREVVEESGLYDFLRIEKIGKVIAHYYNKSKDINRITNTTFFLVVLKSKNVINTKLEDHEKFVLDWVEVKEIISELRLRNQQKDYDHWIYFIKEAVKKLKKLDYIV